MDAPKAPNPANPNEQDQNADTAQGPTNQAQGPAEQNQAQVPLAQIPIQVPAVKFQFRFPHRLVKIYLSNHYNNQSICN